MWKSSDAMRVRNGGPAINESRSGERLTGEGRLAIVLATLLGGFSVLWVINCKFIEMGQALMMLR